LNFRGIYNEVHISRTIVIQWLTDLFPYANSTLTVGCSCLSIDSPWCPYAKLHIVFWTRHCLGRFFICQKGAAGEFDIWHLATLLLFCGLMRADLWLASRVNRLLAFVASLKAKAKNKKPHIYGQLLTAFDKYWYWLLLLLPPLANSESKA